MNVLILTKTLNTGGVSIVSIFLANNLSIRGYNMSLFILQPGTGEQADRVDKAVDVFYGNGIKYSKENVRLIREVLKKKKIDIVINQWGLHWMTIKMIREAQGSLPIRVLTEYHSNPDTNGRLQDVNIQIANTSSPIRRTLLGAKRYLIEQITKNSMKYVYRNSDKYLLLSPSYRDIFVNFTHIKSTDKLMVQTNPIVTDKGDYVFKPQGKQKSIVFVGRLDNNAKRVLRVIEVWKHLEPKYPDWSLNIVGDGPEMEHLKEKIAIYKLQRATLHGFCNPVKFYCEASILILVSEYEGFPLILPEAMQFGVVPAVYGSYSAVYDIVSDGIDGKILPYNKNGFGAKDMGDMIGSIIDMPAEQFEEMQRNAIKKSQQFSKDVILNQWEQKFKETVR